MKRNYSIDLLRIMSAIAVVIIHVVTAPLNNITFVVDPALKSILSAFHHLSYWAVPVFFMITGYCMALKKECTYKYCFSQVAKFVAVLFTVGLFYALLEEVFTARTVSIAIRSPYTRPVLPRTSSAISGFFFCGIIEEPVV